MTLHVAQMNVARLAYEQDDSALDDFMDALDTINGLGEQSPGFVWRYQDESGSAVDTHVFDDPRIIINYTIWESISQLKDFAYNGAHLEYFRRRGEWFEPATEPSQVMWWVPAGEIPSVPAALDRLAHLRANGPGPAAFGFADARHHEPAWIALP